MWCVPAYECLKLTQEQAESKCSEDPQCHMFYDFQNEHDYFCFCQKYTFIKVSTSGSYLYTKGEYIIFGKVKNTYHLHYIILFQISILNYIIFSV